MRSVGCSMDVERMVKPVKHSIATDPKGVALFRLGENLKHIMKVKKMLCKKITESLILVVYGMTLAVNVGYVRRSVIVW